MKVDEIDKDRTRLLNVMTDSMYAVSYLLTHLITSGNVFKEALLDWQRETIYPKFLLEFDFSPDMLKSYCSDCHFKHARPINCKMDFNRSEIQLELLVQKTDSDLSIIQADPFDMIIRTQHNKTCRARYTGPQHLIIDNKRNLIQ